MTTPHPAITKAEQLANTIADIFDIDHASRLGDPTKRRQALLMQARTIIMAAKEWLNE